MSLPAVVSRDSLVRRVYRRLGPRARQSVRDLVRDLGPGVTTGAADDDPSGISTYSIAGASFGLATLWTTVFSVPLMIGVQLTCARIGLVTHRGLAAVLRDRYPAWVAWTACLVLVVANTVNIAADLAGMAEGLELVTGVPSLWFHCILAGVVLAALIFSSYRTMARWLKWLTLALLAYVVAALLAHPSWAAVARATLLPRLTLDRRYLLLLVALFGTTISPYLFFWQTSQEVEESTADERVPAVGVRQLAARHGSLTDRFRAAARDVTVGMFASNFIAFFIMLTTGVTLFAAGQRDISSAREAALALRPLAGSGAALLFTLGLVGAGLLAVPVLAGSSAYAVAEAGGWHGRMDARPNEARAFYATLAGGLLLGMLLDHSGVSGLRLLLWAAVLNGLLAPPLLILLLVVANDRRTMGAHRNGWVLNSLTGLAAAVMTAVALAFLWA